MYLLSRKMVQYNGFPNRLLELVSHGKDVERLEWDRRRETESKEVHTPKNTPKDTVVFMKGLTSPVWTLVMFQMVTEDSWQCMKRTKQSTTCDITVRHTAWTVSGCGFVDKYQNTSNLENHYVTTGTDHKELVDRLTSMSLLLSQQTRSLDVTSSLSSGLFERIGFCQCPTRKTNSTTS